MQSINDRINPYAKKPLIPVLRWETGRATDTIRMESGLIHADENLDNEIGYFDPFAVWGDNGDSDMMDAPISDEDWARLLDCVGIR